MALYDNEYYDIHSQMSAADYYDFGDDEEDGEKLSIEERKEILLSRGIDPLDLASMLDYDRHMTLIDEGLNPSDYDTEDLYEMID